MLDCLEACREFNWSVRPKDAGYIVSPPPRIRRPGFETIFVFAPKDNKERKLLGQRLKSAGLPIKIVETEVTYREVGEDMNKTIVPPASATSLPVAKVTVSPDESTIDRVRRKIHQIADLCAEVSVDLDALAKEREDFVELKALLKKIGG